MEAGPPQPQDPRRRAPLGGAGSWCLAAGLLLAAASVTGLALGGLSARQAGVLAIASALLIVGGLALVASADPGAAWRLGFRAGQRASSLARLWRSIFRR